jgi:uncharacterized delta-60 repeat protein
MIKPGNLFTAVKTLFILALFSVLTIYGAAGDLDPTFSQDGKTLTSVGKGRDEARDAVLQPDGKIVVAGVSGGDTRHISLARYNADGSLDPSFGTGGKVISSYPDSTNATEVGLQSDGKIVIAGTRGTGQIPTPIIGRYNPDGSPDTVFGTNGIRDLGFGIAPTDLLIQPDNKIVISGVTQQQGPFVFRVARLNSNGTPDPGFGINGLASASIGTFESAANAVALQSDGKIVLAGSGSNGADSDFALVRFNTDGTLDSTFDGDGRVIFPVGAGNDEVFAVKIQPDGKIVAAGSIEVSAPSISNFGVARLNSDGSLDTSFDGDGKIVVPVGATSDNAYSVGLQSDGKIVVSGNSFIDFSVIRLLTNGALDASFGSGGKVILPIANSNLTRLGTTVIQPDDRLFLAGYEQDSTLQADYALFQLSASGTTLFSKLEEFDASDNYGQDVAVQADGKIVVAGYSSAVGVSDVALARYNPDGSLDASFGSGGKVALSEPSFQRANCLAIQPDGKIVVAGAGEGSAFGALVVYRFNTDGSLDTSFDGDGKFLLTQFDRSEGNDIVIQPDGKLVIAGTISFTMAVVRLNANGGLDTGFGTGGYVAFGCSGFCEQRGYAVAVQPDGRVVAGGQRFLGGGPSDGVWIRLNANGSVEGSNPNILGASIKIEDVAILPNGKIVFGGTYPGTTPSNSIGVARFNADKTLDTGFGTNSGYSLANFGNSSFGKSLVIQSGGQIVVGGYVDLPTDDFALARFTANGLLDTGFGTAGKVVTPITAYDDQINGLALQADGKIVAAGQAYNSTDWDFAVARYDGSASPSVPPRTRFDYDGDGKADVSVFRASENQWYVLQSSNFAVVQKIFAVAGDIAAPADYDGDGKTDFAIFRPSTGDFWYLSSINNAQINVHWGQSGDIPRPADFDGDGKADFIVYRPSNSVWYRFGSTGAISILAFGIAEDKPLIGDFDGDGKADQAIFRPSTGDWWYASSVSGQFLATHWGATGDVPVPADYDGDGKTDFAIFRPSNGGWFISNSSNGSFTTTSFGLSTDKPVAADFDGDGKADIAVYRPSTGTWYLLQTTAGFGALQFGNATDLPTENAFVP